MHKPVKPAVVSYLKHIRAFVLYQVNDSLPQQRLNRFGTIVMTEKCANQIIQLPNSNYPYSGNVILWQIRFKCQPVFG